MPVFQARKRYPKKIMTVNTVVGTPQLSYVEMWELQSMIETYLIKRGFHSIDIQYEG